MDGTIIQQGSFTSDGTVKELDIRSDVDWMEVWNYTQMATQDTPGVGVQFYWQRGMAAGTGIEITKADGGDALQGEVMTSGGFTLLPKTLPGPVTGTTITKAGPPVCTAAGHGFSNGDLVVFSSLTEMPQIALVAFTIGSVTTNTFELSYFDTNTANFTAESAFTVRKIDPFMWNTAWNNITAVTTGTTTQIQLAAATTETLYAVGDVLTFSVPSEYGMTQLDGVSAEVLSYVSATNTYTVDLDSTGFTAFAWPAASAVPLRLPTVRVVGSNSTSPNDAVYNTGILGMELGAGIDGPAGASSDVIYWKAGKSFNVATS